MKAELPPSSYDGVAEVYDLYWGTASLLWLRTFGLLVLPRIARGARILDLCCGTGRLAGELSRRGFTLVGLDGSREMLRHGRKNAPTVPLIEADARRFGMRPSFDVVLSTFDSLNHILTLNELQSAFRCVHDCLRPGGLFFFDLNTELGYLRHWNDSSEIVGDDHTMKVTALYDRTRRLGLFRATIEHRAGGQVEEVELRQRCHASGDVISALEAGGFTDIETFGLEQEAIVPDCLDSAERAFYLCKRPAAAAGAFRPSARRASKGA
ncbi:MAG: class I SAM-dependent methyltransferase [Chloroflexi bacterium]|nr:class I SAM-dependent methyltransferase [Chloroflexota bacterium]